MEHDASAVGIRLLLFTTDPPLAGRAVAAGIDGLVVDLERRGKERRQRNADTEINADTVEDLSRLASVPAALRVCRLNAWGPWSPGEVDGAIGHGATHLLLPMVRRTGEVEAALKAVNGRCPLGILVETRDACARAPELARLPLALVYVGLNDLAIDRGSASIFDAVADGTVERLREAFGRIPFGFGGLTVVDGGRPVPCALLLAEMARLACSFSFLRRSFKRDIVGRDMAGEIALVRARWASLRSRSPEQVASDHAALIRVLAG